MDHFLYNADMKGPNQDHPRDECIEISTLVMAYCNGLFPMAPSRDSDLVEWFRPMKRGVLPLDDYHCPRNLRKLIRQQRFSIHSDRAFTEVIAACAEIRSETSETWINDKIVDAYSRLHHANLAHSVEAWLDDQLVGGLYGVCIRGAFFGESMFHRPHLGGTDASKVCLAFLVDHLQSQKFRLLDTQMNSPHLSRFGVVEMDHDSYMDQLECALEVDRVWDSRAIGKRLPSFCVI